MIAEGKKAPEFSLPDAEGKLHSLSDFRGKKVVLYFYPKDDTPGCTTEACAFRDNSIHFTKKNIIIIGISADSVENHKKFVEKYKLPFLLLSDVTKKTIMTYDAWGIKKLYGKSYEGVLRITYLIDERGVIKKTYSKVTPATHAQDILKEI